MSYDLYLYLKKDSSVSVSDIENYLSENIAPVSDYGQWDYENEDTDVNFMFEKYDGDDEAEDLEPVMLDGFEPAGINFTINFIRPDFFGLEVFPLVDKLLQEFDIYVLNLQNEPVIPPYRPEPGELYEQWSRQNIHCRGLLPDDVDLYYYPIERSTALWQHNFAHSDLQEKLGDEYFVPNAMFVKLVHNSKAASITTWTLHIPTVLPKVDYVLLNREYKKFFRTVKDQGVISYSNLMAAVGEYFEDSEIEGSKIIHPDNTSKLSKIFNTLKLDHPVEGFCEYLPAHLITNVEPDQPDPGRSQDNARVQ